MIQQTNSKKIGEIIRFGIPRVQESQSVMPPFMVYEPPVTV